MKRILFVFLTVLAASTASAEVLSPVLIVKGAKKGEYVPVKIAAMKVDTKIVGTVATTTIDMTFSNELDRVLEGRLVFPLPEGSSVVRFALDVQGKLRDGVIVAKHKGRKVFEKVVRSQIDPGLLEWVKGNNFRARIYPLPAKGTRRALLAYEQELPEVKGGLLFRLPLAYKEPIGKFSLRIAVTGAPGAPSFSMSPFKDLGFRVDSGSQVAETHFDNMSVEGEIGVRVPLPADGPAVYLDTVEDETYFCVSLRPEGKTAPRTLPKRVTVLWDASGSAKGRDITRELVLLREYVKKLGAPQIHLVLVRNMAVPFGSFGGEAGIDSVVKTIEKAAYDGGTDLGCIPFAKLDKDTDEYILVTDGNTNVGEEGDEKAAGPGKPVQVFSTSASANHPYLRNLAGKSGGNYFNLLAMDDSQVLLQLTTQGYRFKSLIAEEKGSVIDSFPSTYGPVSGRFTVVGRLAKLSAGLTLTFQGPDKEIFFKFSVGEGALKDTSGMVRRMWARRKIADLAVFPSRNEKAMLKLGQKFTIVTPATSLIVLERIEDYVRYDIIPPEELREQFWQLVEKRKALAKKTQEQRIVAVLKRWTVLKSWWKTVFKYPENLRVSPKGDKAEAMDDEAEGGEDGAPEAEQPSEGRGGGSGGAAPAFGGRARRLSKKKNGGGGPPKAGITLKKWDPKTPYLAALKKAEKGKEYETYLGLKKDYAASSAFYLDVADFFSDAGAKNLGLRILTNIAEMEIENPQLLRILAHRLDQMKQHKLAALVFRKVLKLRPEEPQSWRDLALVLAKMGKYKEAVGKLYKVVLGKWDGRFRGIDQIALVEMNDVIRKALAAGATNLGVDERFIQLLDVDLRIILTWDADNCDMDLWVIEPSGEKCFYSHRNTRIGGHMSRDYTGGYGPEEYLLRKAMPGKYVIKINYYGNRQQVLAGATTIQVLVVKNYGRANEERISITRRLKDQKEVLTIGDVEYAKKK